MAISLDDAIANALAGVNAPVVARFRYEQRTKTNVFVEDISNAVVVGGQLDVNNSRAVSRTCSLKIRPSLLPDSFDPDTSFFAPFMEILVNGSYQRFQLGLFTMDAPGETHEPNEQETWDIKASDLSYLLLAPRADPYTVQAGTNYMLAAQGLIQTYGLQTNLPITSLTTPVAFTWPASTPPLNIVNDLMEGANHYDVYPDETGRFTTRQRIDPAQEAIDVTYGTGYEPRMVQPIWAKDTANSQFPNRFVVKMQDPLRTPIAVAAQNDDPTSKQSTVSRGGVVASQDITIERLADQTTGFNAAKWFVWNACASAKTGVLRTALDPRRAAHETYALYIEQADIGTRWRVNSWSMQLVTGGAMQHNLGLVKTVILATTVVT